MGLRIQALILKRKALTQERRLLNLLVKIRLKPESLTRTLYLDVHE